MRNHNGDRPGDVRPINIIRRGPSHPIIHTLTDDPRRGLPHQNPRRRHHGAWQPPGPGITRGVPEYEREAAAAVIEVRAGEEGDGEYGVAVRDRECVDAVGVGEGHVREDVAAVGGERLAEGLDGVALGGEADEGLSG